MIPKYIIDAAKNEAEKSEMRYKLGAIIYDKKYKILGKGHNRFFRQSEKMMGLKISGNVSFHDIAL